MKCGECGGYAEWKGPLSDLTHSECSQCGAIDAHEDDEGERICSNCEGDNDSEDDDVCGMCRNWLSGREP